jgi:hypothetical protein
MEQSPAAPETPTAPAPSPLINPGVMQRSPTAELTASEAATMSGWIKEDWIADRISSEAAERAFKDLGTSMSEQLKPDTRSEEVKALDAAYPPAKPNEYVISYGDLPASPELKQFDESARTWLAACEFDSALGNTLVNTIERVARQTKDMTPQQLESFAKSEFEKLQGVYGTNLERKLNDAGLMVQEIERKRPGIKRLLSSQGLGDSSMVAAMLIQQSERYWLRRRQK